MTPRLLEKYRKTVVPALKAKFGYKNMMAIPKITKVVINTGVGRLLKDDKALQKVERDLSLICGQKASARKAKKSVSSFKLREGVVVGYAVTLRGKRMYDFMDRLISVAIPASKDFRGIDLKNFDKLGNLNFGIKEQSIFPEVTYETLKDIFGLQITVTTTSKNKEEGIELLRLLGFPLKLK